MPKRTKRRVGRKTKLTPAVSKAICDGVRSGLSNKDAARCAGVVESTFYKWLERAAKGDPDPRFAEFAEHLKEALSEFKQVHLANIERAGLQVRTKRRSHAKRKRDPETGNMVVETEEAWTDQELPSWQASAWLLERKFPEEFSKRRVEHEHSGKVAVEDARPRDVTVRLVQPWGEEEVLAVGSLGAAVAAAEAEEEDDD